LRKWRDWVRHLAVHGRNPTGSILPPRTGTCRHL
jgi:hypothetical protein